MEEEKEEKLAINREDAEEKGRRRRRSASFSLSFLQTLVFLLRRVYSLLPRPPSFLSFANSVLQPSLLFSLACSLTLLIYSAQEGQKRRGRWKLIQIESSQRTSAAAEKEREREKILFLIKYREADRLRSLVVFFFFPSFPSMSNRQEVCDLFVRVLQVGHHRKLSSFGLSRRKEGIGVVRASLSDRGDNNKKKVPRLRELHYQPIIM